MGAHELSPCARLIKNPSKKNLTELQPQRHALAKHAPVGRRGRRATPHVMGCPTGPLLVSDL
jgi:hypothetical protein